MFIRMCLASLAFSYAAMGAAAGKPDPSFGGDGHVVMHFDIEQPRGSEYAFDVLIDHAGRLVTVGSAYVGPDKHNFTTGLITRHLSNGSPDHAFNGLGRLHLEWQGYGFYFASVLEQADGKLLVAGELQEYLNGNTVGKETVVCRLEENGNLDIHFGKAGCRTLETVGGRPGLDNAFRGFALRPDGRILVLGDPVAADPRSFALVQLRPDGKDDLEFGDAAECPDPQPRCGIAFSPAEYGNLIDSSRFAIDPQDGRVIVVGDIFSQFFTGIVTLPYSAEGDSEPALTPLEFSGLLGGSAATYEVTAVKVLPDQSIFSVVQAGSGGKYRVVVGKLKADGMPDDAFGSSGRAVYAFNEQHIYNSPTAAFLQDDGKLLVVGTSYNNGLNYCRALRIDGKSGALDSAFGLGGIFMFDALNVLAPGDCYAAGIVADDQGRIIAAGSLVETTPDDINPFLTRIDMDALFGDSFDN